MGRLLGFVMLVTGLTGFLVGAVAAMGAGAGVDAAGREADTWLLATSNSLGNTRQSLLALKAALMDLESGVDTLGGSVGESDRGLAQTEATVGDVAKLLGQDLPQGLGDVSQGLNAAAKPAASVDAVLTALTTIQPYADALRQAGITYKPEVSFATSLRNVATSLDATSTRVRALEPGLKAAQQNVKQLRAGNAQTAQDVARLRESIGRLRASVDGYVTDIEGTRTSLSQTREAMRSALAGIRLLATGLAVGFALSQLPAIYLGGQLLQGRRMVAY